MEELLLDLEALRSSISDPRLNDEMRQRMQLQIENVEQQIRELEAQQQQPAAATTPTTRTRRKRSSAAPQVQDSDNEFMNTLLGTIETLLTSNVGSGIDTPQVRNIIQNYLRTDKVKLSELDKSILDEIKKNQIQQLQIPNFSQPIQVSSVVSKIPNFYEIIDDVLAGNNVYLIGEAGGGKTYTAEMIAKTLKREYVTINCSQYTSPLEILGGQSVEGFKQGKLIDCWRNGKILILDEMPKLDSNTAGLFNDALAKSSKTRPSEAALINSANAEEPPIMRNSDFGVIATGNIYPNEPPAPQYRGNNQQDLSLLDRFSGSVYYTEFDGNTDENTTRFKFLYDFLVGNYYQYIQAKASGSSLPTPTGLRTIIEHRGMKNLALVSYRTNISFRVGFEYELVREIARRQGVNIDIIGKTLLKTFKSYMVAFRSNMTVYNDLINETGYTDAYIQNLAATSIDSILTGADGFLDSLNPKVRENADPIYRRYSDFYVAQSVNVK
jgi:DNA replication protein DnaC